MPAPFRPRRPWEQFIRTGRGSQNPNTGRQEGDREPEQGNRGLVGRCQTAPEMTPRGEAATGPRGRAPLRSTGRPCRPPEARFRPFSVSRHPSQQHRLAASPLPRQAARASRSASASRRRSCLLAPSARAARGCLGLCSRSPARTDSSTRQGERFGGALRPSRGKCACTTPVRLPPATPATDQGCPQPASTGRHGNQRQSQRDRVFPAHGLVYGHPPMARFARPIRHGAGRPAARRGAWHLPRRLPMRREAAGHGAVRRDG